MEILEKMREYWSDHSVNFLLVENMNNTELCITVVRIKKECTAQIIK